ncbi:MAG: translation elongation factor Ts [Bacteroidota bacterium]|nr:translation elongation factor Ts [Bacteroidota bacterium]MDP3144722.1 translation elongation factor Ts [Bacteroidota bacterium]MDP3557901.1 translation elongation factor Ts [Bacteroidota bacterium]
MAITAAEVNKLRQQTGAGMMDCKKALEESNGDFEAAVDFLRKKGAKVAANRADRDAKEGVVLAKTSSDNKTAVVISVNCETDFVAQNADFIKFADTVAGVALAKQPTSIDELKALPYEGSLSIGDKFMEQIGKIGEKIDIGFYNVIKAEQVVGYIHPGNRLAVAIGFNKQVSTEVAKNIAMQAAAMAPVAIDKDDVDSTVINRELEIARETTRAEGKPEDMVEKIAQGKLNKFYKDSTLLNQEYFIDNKMTVRQFLQSVEKDLTVSALKRYSLS